MPAALERALIAHIVALARARRLSHSALARAAFTQAKDPGGKWRKIRNSGGGLHVAEAVALAQALGLDLSALVWQAEQAQKQSPGD